MTTTSEAFFVSVGGTRVRVRKSGSGPPLMMLMGIGGNLDMWAPLADRLPDRELVMFDFPGTGDSALSWVPPTMSTYALLVRRLLSKLGYKKVDLLGYSWGGLLAQQVAIQHGGSVRRLVLACTTVGLGGVPPGPSVARHLLTPRRYHSREHFTRVAPKFYGGRFRDDDALVQDEADRRLDRPPGYVGYAAQLLATTCYSSVPGLPLIGAPTLIIAGDDDPIISTTNQKLLARLIRNSQLHIIAGAGHLVLLDSPEIVAPLITDFLNAGD